MSDERKRLTVSTVGRRWAVFLDRQGVKTGLADTPEDAIAAAEAYVAELLAHFRGGGT